MLHAALQGDWRGKASDPATCAYDGCRVRPDHALLARWGLLTWAVWFLCSDHLRPFTRDVLIYCPVLGHSPAVDSLKLPS